MTALTKKLDRLLTGTNPVEYHKLTPDEWLELRALIPASAPPPSAEQ